MFGWTKVVTRPGITRLSGWYGQVVRKEGQESRLDDELQLGASAQRHATGAHCFTPPISSSAPYQEHQS